jgi:hypothetical protein
VLAAEKANAGKIKAESTLTESAWREEAQRAGKEEWPPLCRGFFLPATEINLIDGRAQTAIIRL